MRSLTVTVFALCLLVSVTHNSIWSVLNTTAKLNTTLKLNDNVTVLDIIHKVKVADSLLVVYF